MNVNDDGNNIEISQKYETTVKREFTSFFGAVKNSVKDIAVWFIRSLLPQFFKSLPSSNSTTFLFPLNVLFPIKTRAMKIKKYWI